MSIIITFFNESPSQNLVLSISIKLIMEVYFKISQKASKMLFEQCIQANLSKLSKSGNKQGQVSIASIGVDLKINQQLVIQIILACLFVNSLVNDNKGEQYERRNTTNQLYINNHLSECQTHTNQIEQQKRKAIFWNQTSERQQKITQVIFTQLQNITDLIQNGISSFTKSHTLIFSLAMYRLIIYDDFCHKYKKNYSCQCKFLIQMKTNSSGGVTLWLTGLSGSGKTTIGNMLTRFLEDELGIKCFNLDGDKVRTGLNKDLKFSKEDRAENIRRIAETSKLCNLEGLFVIVSCISPYAQDRDRAKKIHQEMGLLFFEVFVAAGVEICGQRDTKGLYKKARDGLIPNFTGVNDPYQCPVSPDLILQEKIESQNESLVRLINFLKNKGIIKTTKPHLAQSNIKYLDFYAGIQELNILQTIQQKWTNCNNLMDYAKIIECLYFCTNTLQEKQFFQPMPLFFVCDSKLKQQADNMKVDKLQLNVRVISKCNNQQIAVLKNAKFEKFRIEEICSKVYGTFSPKHPSIESLLAKGEYILSGQELVFKKNQIMFYDGLDQYRKSSSLIRQQFKQRKSDCLFSFQLRNPLHNGHLFLLNKAKEQLLGKGYKKPVLLLHPCGGWVKQDDIPLSVRIEQHKTLLENSNFFKEDEVILAIWPSPMFYAGPREVLWHFCSREMVGTDFMIVGRDPAGIKHPQNSAENLYDEYDGQRVLDLAFKKGWLKTKIIPFRQVSWNKEKKQLQQFNEQKSHQYQNISGSQMRKIGREGKQIPQWFMNQKSWEVLSRYYQNKQ